MTQLRLTIGGMSCQHCVKAVRGLLEQLEGVSDLEVEVGSARLGLPASPGRPALEQMLDEAGFELEDIEEAAS
jgi:copper chaperone